METILSIENLSVEYTIGKKIIPVVRDVSFTVDKNDSIAIVGESGCGKTTIALSILNLLPKEAKITAGKVFFYNQQILQSGTKQLQKIRGKKIGFIFQDPLSSLNPVIKIGEQLRETLKIHGAVSTDAEIEKLLKMVQLDNPERIINSYPHQLSGGMRQRVMIAQALVPSPEILIADEPTTALDTTIQKEILELIKKLRSELNLTVLFITHNFAIASDICNRIIVIYAGEIVEAGTTTEILKYPEHPYTKALLSAIPKRAIKQTRFTTIAGSVSDLIMFPQGCKFQTRCPKKIEKCIIEQPQLKPKGTKLLRCFNL
ncbi:MAG: ABC transporter ATP-binding protein [Elusimicrobiota bacterium]